MRSHVVVYISRNNNNNNYYCTYSFTLRGSILYNVNFRHIFLVQLRGLYCYGKHFFFLGHILLVFSIFNYHSYS